MTFIPKLQLSFIGGWWFSAAFLIAHLVLGFIYPQLRSKALVPPKGKLFSQRIAMFLTFILFQSRIILAAFIPISFIFPFFYVGALFAAAAFVCYLSALITFVKAPGDKPVTHGVYRVTRNPQQIFSIILWTSVGLMLGTFLFPLLGMIEFFLSYPGFQAQEQFCLTKYGDKYRSYMKTTPRYFFF